jgi:hypothetical protein
LFVALESSDPPTVLPEGGGEQCMSVSAEKASPACNSLEFHGWHAVLALELSVFARM